MISTSKDTKASLDKSSLRSERDCDCSSKTVPADVLAKWWKEKRKRDTFSSKKSACNPESKINTSKWVQLNKINVIRLYSKLHRNPL